MKAGNTGHISNVLGTQLPTLGLKPPEEQLWPEQFLIAGVFLALSTHSCQLLPPTRRVWLTIPRKTRFTVSFKTPCFSGLNMWWGVLRITFIFCNNSHTRKRSCRLPFFKLLNHEWQQA